VLGTRKCVIRANGGTTATAAAESTGRPVTTVLIDKIIARPVGGWKKVVGRLEDDKYDRTRATTIRLTTNILSRDPE